MAAIGIGCSAHAGVLHVDDDAPNDRGPNDNTVSDPLEDGSAEHPYDAIQEAIVAAGDGDEILVAPGTYHETINLLGRAVTLHGVGGAAVTTIDAQASGTAVTCDGGEGPGTVIRGFTITHGSAEQGGGMINLASSPTVAECTFHANIAAADGGGIYNSAGSAPTVIDCTFTDNVAGGCAAGTCRGRGGGIYTGDSTATVIGCVFEANQAFSSGAAMYNSVSTVDVTRCTFTFNLAGGCSEGNCGGRGGGIYNLLSDLTLSECVFHGNDAIASGGGVYTTSTAIGSVAAFSCSFTDNTAILGGGIFDTSPGQPGATVTNCVFGGNSASGFGGGIYYAANPTVASCTFSGNSAALGGGLFIAATTTRATVTNCIAWGNSPDQIRDGNQVAEVKYSNVQGGFAGVGNIDADPLFGDPDLRLSADSPCRDAGNNWAVPPDEGDLDGDGDRMELTPLDLDGNPRFAGDAAEPGPGCGAPVVVDMGAYELAGDPVAIVFADLDGDGVVRPRDLMILNGCVGSPQQRCCLADLNLDDLVDAADRRLLRWNLVRRVP